MFDKEKEQSNEAGTVIDSEAADTQTKDSCCLTGSLDKDTEFIENLFKDVDIMISRPFENSHNNALRYCIFYCDGVVDSMLMNEHIIKPLMLNNTISPGSHLITDVMNQVVISNQADISTETTKIIEAITYGDTVLIADGCTNALIINSKSFTTRSVSEPENEKVLTGPREGFTESVMQNLSLLRRRIRSNELKTKFMPIGKQTNTQVCVCYMGNIVNKKILKELYRRLNKIEIDGILDSNYITEHISEVSLLGFNTAGYTERPDIVAGKMLEGRIAILVDGSPMVLTIPHLFIENFQSNEDYYTNYYYASFSRILRFIGFFLTISIPGLYIAIVSYHHEILPSALMITIATERQSVPLPAAAEAFVMLLVFDLLRETGIRMPTYIGQALSIVGALVIGQSAVEAQLVAAPMIIVVAITGITNLIIPKLSAAAIMARYGLLILGSCLGLFGLAFGFSVLLTHIINLKSFGVPELMPLENLKTQDIKDTFVRSPWPKMLTRISPLSYNSTRAKATGSSEPLDKKHTQ